MFSVSIWIFLKVCLCVLAQWCLTLCNPVDCSHQAPCPWDFPGKNTGVGCISSSRGSSKLRDQAWVFCSAGGFFIAWPSGRLFWMFIIEYYIGQWIYVRCVKLDINCLNSDILKVGQPRGVIIKTFLLSKSSSFTFGRGYCFILATKKLA